MIVAAIDNSESTDEYLDFYRDGVLRVLSNLQGPVRVILWSSFIESDCTYNKIVDRDQIFRNFIPKNGTYPDHLLKYLSGEESIDLYLFTDGEIGNYDVEDCLSVLKDEKLNIQISRVSLHYIGIEKNMNTRFTEVFDGFPQEIFIQGKRIAEIAAEPLDFNNVDYDYIMKDESFKATIISLLNKPGTDVAFLKSNVNRKLNEILKYHFEVTRKISIEAFYETRDVPGCCKYIKKHQQYQEKILFQRKMSDINKLFEKGIDTHSLGVYKTVSEPDPIEEKPSEDVPVEELQDEEIEILSCDILYDMCDVACIPVKACGQAFWPDKKMIKNPFRLLESNELMESILCQVEPYIVDYCNAYKNLQNPDISPFSRDKLKGVYILHHPSLDAKAVMRHNNYVLSTFFMNKLPGKPVLWHIVFLYMLATRKFPEHKKVFFRKIRRLSESETYFIQMTPYLNPPIVEKLNVCFWYIACVCPVLYANNNKNILRKEDYISGVILDFYRDVYDPEYKRPKEMKLWQLWFELSSGESGGKKKMAIFSILARYFRHERLGNQEDFGIILYHEKIEPKGKLLDLDTVMKVYHKYKTVTGNYYENLSDLPYVDMRSFDKPEERENKLSHVIINLMTCRPYVKCQTSGKYWKECVGEYNKMKQSYLRLFRRYCIQYNEYPKNSEDLMIFLNKYIYNRNENNVPELFHSTLRYQMNQVMEIFKGVMETYPCDKYLEISELITTEKDRLIYE